MLCSDLCNIENVLFNRMENGVCVAGWVFKGRYGKLTADIYAVVEFFVHYLFHMIAFAVLYGKVIQTSNKVLKRQEDTTSTNTQKVIDTNFGFHLCVTSKILGKNVYKSGLHTSR